MGAAGALMLAGRVPGLANNNALAREKVAGWWPATCCWDSLPPVHDATAHVVVVPNQQLTDKAA